VRSDRVRSLGWAPVWSFDDALAHTVEWYRANLGGLEAAHVVPVVTAPRGPGGAA